MKERSPWIVMQIKIFPGSMVKNYFCKNRFFLSWNLMASQRWSFLNIWDQRKRSALSLTRYEVKSGVINLPIYRLQSAASWLKELIFEFCRVLFAARPQPSVAYQSVKLTVKIPAWRPPTCRYLSWDKYLNAPTLHCLLQYSFFMFTGAKRLFNLFDSRNVETYHICDI